MGLSCTFQRLWPDGRAAFNLKRVGIERPRLMSRWARGLRGKRKRLVFIHARAGSSKCYHSTCGLASSLLHNEQF